MKVMLFDHPDKVGEEELQTDLLLLPDWRKSQVLSFRHLVDRVQCAKGYLLLHQLLTMEYGIHKMPSFVYGKYGKPQLANEKLPKGAAKLQFNLSHCTKGVICVVDNAPVGCDIEVIPDEIDADMLTVCFSEEERQSILSASRPTIEFARMWTIKESLLKLIGIGLIDNLPHVLSTSLAEHVSFSTHVFESNGYVYTMASYTK